MCEIAHHRARPIIDTKTLLRGDELVLTDKCIIVDPRHWLADDGELPSKPLRVRRLAIRVAQCIEYGHDLPLAYARETLLPCRRRPDGAQCLGLLWVTKQEQDLLLAHCPACGSDEFLIHHWQETRWAHGRMEPQLIDPDADHFEIELPAEIASEPAAASRDPLDAVLSELGSRLSPAEVRAEIARAGSPTEVLSAILHSASKVPTRATLERFAPVLIELWNAERAFIPAANDGPTSEPRRIPEKTPRNDPCPCGSGRKFKRCCLVRLH